MRERALLSVLNKFGLFSALALALTVSDLQSALAEDFEISSGATVVIANGNHPLNLQADAMASKLSLSADPMCGLSFTAEQGADGLVLEPQGANQGCPLVAVVPPTVALLRVDGGNGAVNVGGAFSALVVDSGNGDITVNGSIFDTLDLTSSNGRITVDEIFARRVMIESANGPVALRRMTGAFSIVATNGSLRASSLVVPRGSRNTIRKTNGTVNIRGIRLEDAMADMMMMGGSVRVTARSLNGSVRIAGTRATGRGATSMLLGMGSARANLSVRTTNASISVGY
jgi:hypothetical protein